MHWDFEVFCVSSALRRCRLKIQKVIVCCADGSQGFVFGCFHYFLDKKVEQKIKSRRMLRRRDGRRTCGKCSIGVIVWVWWMSGTNGQDSAACYAKTLEALSRHFGREGAGRFLFMERLRKAIIFASICFHEPSVSLAELGWLFF